MNDLDLPPRRTLSPEVRDRIRRTMDIEAPRQNRFRAPLAVAAGVAVLAAGAVMVAQSTGGTGDPVGTQPGSTTTAPVEQDVTPAEVKDALDLCHGALTSEGHAPPRDQWQPRIAMRERRSDSVAVAATAGGRPVFCQVTAETVTVTDPGATPAHAAGTKTGVLLATPNGVLGGVVDPSWSRLGLWVVHKDTGITDSVPAMQGSGLFLLPAQYPAGASVEVYEVIGDNYEIPTDRTALPVEAAAPAPIMVSR